MELAKFYPHYSTETVEFLKCIKFENGLCPEIKKAVGYQKIRAFSDLVDSCRIYEEDNNAHYKIVNEKRSKNQSRGKSYDAPAGRGKQEVAEGQRASGGYAPSSVTCFKCGKPGHKSNVCTTAEVRRCFHCGKAGHAAPECKHKADVCFNYGEEGHISTQCQKSKKAPGAKVFALVETPTGNEDRGTRGMCFVDRTSLVIIIVVG